MSISQSINDASSPLVWFNTRNRTAFHGNDRETIFMSQAIADDNVILASEKHGIEICRSNSLPMQMVQEIKKATSGSPPPYMRHLTLSTPEDKNFQPPTSKDNLTHIKANTLFYSSKNGSEYLLSSSATCRSGRRVVVIACIGEGIKTCKKDGLDHSIQVHLKEFEDRRKDFSKLSSYDKYLVPDLRLPPTRPGEKNIQIDEASQIVVDYQKELLSIKGMTKQDAIEIIHHELDRLGYDQP